jgi:hypothetical protein
MRESRVSPYVWLRRFTPLLFLIKSIVEMPAGLLEYDMKARGIFLRLIFSHVADEVWSRLT